MTQTVPDLYAVLGVRRDATPQQIRTAYRTRARQCHPDAGGSHEQMVELVAAYEILSDPERRREYDAMWHEQSVACDAIYQRTRRAAERAYRDHGQTWEQFAAWMEQESARIEAHPIGRLAAASIAGLVIGGLAGIAAGGVLDIGWAMGAMIGGLAGVAGGALVCGSHPDPGN